MQGMSEEEAYVRILTRLKGLRENLWILHQGRVPHISLVFREIWDSIASSL